MQSRLFTIGYEGADLADFLDTLEDAGVEHVIDIRDLPVSRKRGFSKNGLSEALREIGISYTHLKALGDPKPGREAMKRGDYDTFLEIFSSALREPEAQSALRSAIEIAESAPSVLLCYERSPKHCHRTIVANEMMVDTDFEVRNLGVNPRRQRDQNSKLEIAIR
jgi:uncharacterized protein (DUF488 family)